MYVKARLKDLSSKTTRQGPSTSIRFHPTAVTPATLIKQMHLQLLAGCNIVGRKADPRSIEQRQQDWCTAYNKPSVHGAWPLPSAAASMYSWTHSSVALACIPHLHAHAVRRQPPLG
jgi:hypothetical protein